MNLNSAELLLALQGDIQKVIRHEECRVCEISIDTRTMKPGSLFWAIKGFHFDGHLFLKEAMNKQGIGFIISETQNDIEILKEKASLIIQVKDTLNALQNFASYCRKKINPKVIAITGSNGKTTTKDLVFGMLQKRYRTVCSKKSFNNEIGLPLTLLSMELDTEVVVLEMGMNHPGEIRKLMKIAQPDVGILLNVSPAHIGNFDSFEDLLKAKAEMAFEMKNDGILYLNQALKSLPPFDKGINCHVRHFGMAGSPSVYCSYESPEQNGKGFYLRVKVDSLNHRFYYPGLGLQNAENLAAAVACSYDLGIDTGEISRSLKDFMPPRMRMERVFLPKGTLLINDAYNANPSSAAYAVKTLDEITCDGKKIFVIGNMNELGNKSLEYHESLGELISKTSIDVVFSYGDFAKTVTDKLRKCSRKETQHFNDKKAMALALKECGDLGDIILLKGSRLNAFEDIQGMMEKTDV